MKPAAVAIPKDDPAWEVGQVRSDLAEDARLLRLHDHRRTSNRARRRPSALRDQVREGVGGGTHPARSAQAPLSALGALRRRHAASCTRASSTPTSTSTPRTRSSSSARPASNTVFENLEGFPDGLEDESRGVRQVRPGAPVPQLPRVRRVPVRHRRRDQEGARRSRRRSPRCSTRCSSRRHEQASLHPRSNWTTSRAACCGRGRPRTRRPTSCSASTTAGPDGS